MKTREHKFCEDYVRSGDAEYAARAAGYGPVGARKASWRLLQRPEVVAEIARLMRSAAARIQPGPPMGPIAYLQSVLNSQASPARKDRIAKVLARYLVPKAGASGRKAAPSDVPTVLGFTKPK
jgi:hypothetical protein